jgi:shikimate kinase
MNLIFIYGAPAVGKLTVAKEFSKITGYKLFHNHLVIDMIMSIFDWDHPERRRLARKFRTELFQSAAKNNINIVTTFGNTANESSSLFLKEMTKAIKDCGGTVYLVHLYCDKSELMKRVTGEERKQHGKITTTEHLERKLSEIDVMSKFDYKDTLSIDNTSVSPHDVAKKIKEHFHI